MLDFFAALGFSKFDLALVALCTFGGVIGSFAHAVQLTIDPMLPPNEEGKVYLASKELQVARGLWLKLRLFLGAILGFVLGLYFVGSVQETASTAAKIMALSIVAGYAAPKVWQAQEAALLKQFSSSD